VRGEFFVRFIDLHSQYQRIKDDVRDRIDGVLNRGQYILGAEVKALEQQLADFVGVKHCLAVSSGTDALLVALMALGVTANDEVITTPFSFIATAEVIALLGAKPVFVDIDPNTYNIDVSKIKQVITEHTKAIMPVNLYGQCADFDAINRIAQQPNLPVIEDAAQSFGAVYQSKKSGSLGTISCTSFYPAKPLGCYGDGGACFVNDDLLAEKMRWILNHGQSKRYHHAVLGINGRLDTLQAAVLLSKLEIFNDELEKRQQVASWYTHALKEYIKVPVIRAGNQSAWAQYTIQVSDRDLFRKKLLDHGIPTTVHYPVPLYQQPVFEYLHVNADKHLITEKSAARVVSLPFHPYMTKEEVQHVANIVISSVQ
jgi:UDP-2-acetamido-2-deoxy-ribo-hexuluronate aminotransferase